MIIEDKLTLIDNKGFNNNQSDSRYNVDNFINPTIMSPYAEYAISFYQTRESLSDLDDYRAFIKNIELQFRRSRFYKYYKAYVMGTIGIDVDQIHRNINGEMCELEMHHNFLSLFDITLLITEHILNTVGYVCTFDVVLLLQHEHSVNHIPLVMTTETTHEMYHNDANFYIPMGATFGAWWELFKRYPNGITINIANKVIEYINRGEKFNDPYITNLLTIRQTIMDWGKYNEFNNNYRISNFDRYNIGINSYGNGITYIGQQVFGYTA